MTNGPGGVLTNTSLDGGNLSSHGFTVEGSLPGAAVKILSRPNPTQIVDFCYEFQAGAVHYSTIPLDFYLGGGGGQPRVNMRTVYAPNVVAYGIDGACAQEPPVALCQDLTIFTDIDSCTATISVDNGSFDPEGDPITLEQVPGGPYGLGSTDVTLTVTDDKGASDACTAVVTVVDRELPTLSCVESHNPSGKNVPKASKVNEDGFYQVSAGDNCSVTAIELGGFTLAEGETIKLTQAKGKSGVTFVNTMGPAKIRHFQVGPGDAVITATDGAGNVAAVTCLVPPPPK